MFPKIVFNKLIILKLLHDALLILVVLFSGLLLMESILPGLISGHLGLGIVAGLILINMGTISWLSEELAIANPLLEVEKVNKKEVFFILLIFFIFIFNGVLRIDWILGAIISLLASLVGLLVFFFVQKTD